MGSFLQQKIKIASSTVLSFTILFSALGCSHTQEQEQVVIDNTKVSEQVSKEVMQALNSAKQEKDYRLWVTTSRSITVPGLNPSDFSVAIELCGKQYMPKTGDVIRSEQARVERKKAITFMQQYNERMWVICTKNKKASHK